jgi:hypothetical protein
MTDIYSNYTAYVKHICDLNDISSFKSHPAYTYMLEHVSIDKGAEYLRCIINNTLISEKEIQEYADINDRIGGTQRHDYGSVIASPTSLRYVYFTHLILTHFKKWDLPFYNIVELGGGYGGLLLAIQFFHKKYNVPIQSYTIIDLTEPGRLQSKYLAQHDITIPYQIVDAATYGKDVANENMCLISTYCFSEIAAEHQMCYIHYLFPRIHHGFIAWNNIPLYYFGFDYTEEEEIPRTGSANRFVYF